MSTQTPPVGTEAAWLADPTGRHATRWFDGHAWTEHVAGSDGTQGIDKVEHNPTATILPATQSATAGASTTRSTPSSRDMVEHEAKRLEQAGEWLLTVATLQVLAGLIGAVALGAATREVVLAIVLGITVVAAWAFLSTIAHYAKLRAYQALAPS